jgi:hypothetical protein
MNRAFFVALAAILTIAASSIFSIARRLVA